MSNDDYTLGQRVHYSEHIRRRHSRPGEFLGPNRIWSGEAYPGKRWDGGTGIIVGKRTLSNGDSHWHYDDAPTYTIKETFTAYLVAYDINRKPVHVLPEHLSAVVEPDPAIFGGSDHA